MKNWLKKLVAMVMGVILVFLAVAMPVYAAGEGGTTGGSTGEVGGCAGGVKTTLFGGCYTGGITGVLAIALDMLTYGLAAAGVIGIVISGIQYMTASGDPAQMTKAKRRLIEVIIGLVAYGLVYVFLKFWIPNF